MNVLPIWRTFKEYLSLMFSQAFLPVAIASGGGEGRAWAEALAHLQWLLPTRYHTPRGRATPGCFTTYPDTSTVPGLQQALGKHL